MQMVSSPERTGLLSPELFQRQPQNFSDDIVLLHPSLFCLDRPGYHWQRVLFWIAARIDNTPHFRVFPSAGQVLCVLLYAFPRWSLGLSQNGVWGGWSGKEKDQDHLFTCVFLSLKWVHKKLPVTWLSLCLSRLSCCSCVLVAMCLPLL